VVWSLFITVLHNYTYIVSFVVKTSSISYVIRCFCGRFQDQYELLYDIVVEYLDCFATYSNFK